MSFRPPTIPETRPAAEEAGAPVGRRAQAAIVWGRLRALTRLAGLSYLVLTVVARLPVMMLPLGTLVMVASWTHDMLGAGYAAGTVALSIAVAVPVYGIVADRIGQRVVLLFCGTTNIAAILWLISEGLRLQAHEETQIWRLLAACAATGFSSAPTSALARIRWASESRRLADRTLLNSSLAFESVSDVLSIVVGAAVTGLSSVLWRPHASLLVVIAIDLGSVLVLAYYRLRHAHSPLPRPAREDPDTDSVRHRLLWYPVVGMGTLGLLLGSMQASLVSFTYNFDTIETVGLLYAIMGISSLVAAVLATLFRLPTAGWGPWLLWACLLTLVGLPVSMPGSDATMALSLVAEGAVVGVALIVTDAVAVDIAPTRLLDLAMTSTFAALLGGLALGLAWGAVLGDAYSYSAALMLPVIAAAGYLVLAHLYGMQWRRAFEDTAPKDPQAARPRGLHGRPELPEDDAAPASGPRSEPEG